MRMPRAGEEFGPYQVDAQLGMGGMGVVLRATDTRLGRTVALKVLSNRLAGSDEFRRRFHREADVLASLDSPHIIAIYDHAELDGCPYLATQYVGGGDLDQLLRERGGLPPQVAAGICAQVAEALRDAHRAGVVHRDVKPSNVLLRDPHAEVPYALLCDFGIAQTDADGEPLTAAGAVAGSWAYLAPERARGAAGTPASDIYALGCVLWATLTGSAPYAGSDAQIAIAHLQGPIPQLPGIDPTAQQLNAVLRRALAKEPADRYTDVDAIRRDLLHLSRGTTGALPSVDRSPTRSARAAWLGMAVAVSLVLGGAAAWHWWPQGDDAPRPLASDPTDRPTAAQSTLPAADQPISGDHDGDGYGDLLFQHYRGKKPSHRVVVPSTGSGFSEPSLTPWNPWKPPPSTDIQGDFDGDGKTERLVIVAEPRPQTVTITALDAPGGAKTLTHKRPVRANCITWAAGDFDGDGHLDLAAVIGPEKGHLAGVWVMPGTGTGVGFRKPTLWLAKVPFPCGTSFLPGDFDGDGRADLAVVDLFAAQGTISMRLARSTAGRFVLGRTVRVPDDSYSSATVLVGDFDGDAVSEVALYTPSRAARDIRVIDVRRGRFTQGATWVALPSRRYEWDHSAVTVSDVNGDHLDDIVRIGHAKAGRAAYPLDVFVSNGSAFGRPEAWGRFNCRRACDDPRDADATNGWS